MKLKEAHINNLVLELQDGDHLVIDLPNKGTISLYCLIGGRTKIINSLVGFELLPINENRVDLVKIEKEDGEERVVL